MGDVADVRNKTTKRVRISMHLCDKIEISWKPETAMSHSHFVLSVAFTVISRCCQDRFRYAEIMIGLLASMSYMLVTKNQKCFFLTMYNCLTVNKTYKNLSVLIG